MCGAPTPMAFSAQRRVGMFSAEAGALTHSALRRHDVGAWNVGQSRDVAEIFYCSLFVETIFDVVM
jgi:hypothetical protein